MLLLDESIKTKRIIVLLNFLLHSPHKPGGLMTLKDVGRRWASLTGALVLLLRPHRILDFLPCPYYCIPYP